MANQDLDSSFLHALVNVLCDHRIIWEEEELALNLYDICFLYEKLSLAGPNFPWSYHSNLIKNL